MASTHVRPNGKYLARWRVKGRERCKTFTTKRAAQRWLAEVQADIARGTYVDRSDYRSEASGGVTVYPDGWYVYVLWGDNSETPLYVGQSTQVLSRLNAHMANKSKRQHVRRVTLLRRESQADTDRLEASLIDRHRPPWNISLRLALRRLEAKS